MVEGYSEEEGEGEEEEGEGEEEGEEGEEEEREEGERGTNESWVRVERLEDANIQRLKVCGELIITLASFLPCWPIL